MTDLGRDARALVARVKRRDGPTAGDRARLRSRLEPVWAAQSADAMTGVPEMVPRAAHGWVSWVSGLLLISLGFVAPEAPRALAPTTVVLAAAKPSLPEPGRARQPEQPPAAQSGAREQPIARQLATAAEVRQTQPATALRSRAAERRGGLRPVRKLPPPPAASAMAPAGAAPAPPAPREASEVPVHISEAPARPSAAAPHESVAAVRSSELATPNVRSRAFAPQPIDDELTWLSAAQEALRNNQPSAALRLVQEHAFRFPQGALASERVAVHALALCALSRKAAARAVVSDLEDRAPNSPLLARVRRNCGF